MNLNQLTHLGSTDDFIPLNVLIGRLCWSLIPVVSVVASDGLWFWFDIVIFLCLGGVMIMTAII